MQIVMGLYYYYPYISGLSVYARRLAEDLVARGHKVTIVTCRFDKALSPEEEVNGVLVKRVPYLLKIDKGVVMPSFVPIILRLGRRADIINLHLPMAEASVVAMLAPGKTVLTYHCDPRLNNRSVFALWLESMIYRSLRVAVRRAAATVSQSFDYAANSKVLGNHLDKVTIIPPPISPRRRPKGAKLSQAISTTGQRCPRARKWSALSAGLSTKRASTSLSTPSAISKKNTTTFISSSPEITKTLQGEV